MAGRVAALAADRAARRPIIMMVWVVWRRSINGWDGSDVPMRKRTPPDDIARSVENAENLNRDSSALVSPSIPVHFSWRAREEKREAGGCCAELS